MKRIEMPDEIGGWCWVSGCDGSSSQTGTVILLDGGAAITGDSGAASNKLAQ